ncbi:MAG: exodeoxyribonuclease VII large subunit [Patescibacteria group bacterium]|nr:exodeoxyribonuclease VII large subunit [Patescibacteria group bacterium]
MKAYSVTEFIEFLNAAFSAAVFPEGVTVEGEVADYRVSQGKWIWFLLKDEESTVSCFATVWQLRTPLEDGMQVRIYGMPKVYPKSGKFSVVVERAEPVGEGALRRAFELLKKKLEKEGLFDVDRKRSLSRFPGRIGLIASGESAAYSDFLRILKNRWGGVEINHIHVQVQGKDAESTIVSAFAHFNAHPELADVLVLTRGGGSLEDLHAFNSEDVARAVFSSKIPVVVGVGHERDESLADYVADVRASTPSNAAEIIAPDRDEVSAAVDSAVRRMGAAMEGELMERMARVDRFVYRLESGVMGAVSSFRYRLRDFATAFRSYATRVEVLQRDCAVISDRLTTNIGFWMGRLTDRLASHGRVLAGLDPERVLKRGYAIVRKGDTPLKDSTDIKVSDDVDIRLHRGGLTAKVIEINGVRE